jgi:hypothetical protein
MLGVGYDAATSTIYFHDTWDNNLHQTTWTGTYSGYNYELKAVTVINLAPFICGDANNDGVIDVGDVVYLINYLFKSGPEPRPVQCAGDCNGDTIVDVGDVVYLINYLFKSGPAPIAGCCG